LIPENVHYLKEGLIDFLISQKAETQGHEGIYALYRHVVLRQPCEKNIMMPIDIITKENLIYYNRY
jgi:LacI family transcriptional regulator